MALDDTQARSAAPRRRVVKHAGQMRYVSFGDGKVYAEWGDGVMVHLFRRLGFRFKFKVWRIR